MSLDNESYKIDNSDDVNFRDSLSKKRVAFNKQRRTLRQEKKDLKKSYKEILNQLNNTADRRKLKDEYQSAIKDVDTRLNNLADKNKQGIDNDVHSGIDSIQSGYIEAEEFQIPAHALQLVEISIAKLCVRQGTINNVVPKIGTTPLATNVEDNSLSLSGTGTREYWLKVTLDSDGDVTDVTIENNGSFEESATQAKLLLGSVETNSGNIVAFNSNLSGSQSLASCGANHFFGVV